MLCSLAVFPLWEVGGWGLGMTVLVMVVTMVVMIVVLVLVLVLVLKIARKGANERKDACKMDISTTRGCAFGEIAVVAVRGIVWCAVGATCGSIYGGLLPDDCVPRRGPGTAKGFSMACFVCAAWFRSASCMSDGALRRSALCASDEGWKRAWLRAVGMALVSREGASALGGREMVLVLVLSLALGWQRHFDGQPSDGGL